MISRRYLVLASLATAVVLLPGACKKEQEVAGYRYPILPEEVYRYDSLPLSISFDPFGGHVIDNHLATLGRVLFYETRLSINNRVSCGSCHLQRLAFSDNKAKSTGFSDKTTFRNTPPIVNVGLQAAFFWDLRQPVLADMVLNPIADHIEMGLESNEHMLAKISKLPYYAPLFENAFGDPEVTRSRIAAGLEMFMRSIVSINTAFDIGRNSAFVNFTPEQEFGRQLFFHKFPCSACHGGSELSGLSNASNVGLEMHYKDPGVHGFLINGDPLNGWFKVPSLRNVEFTAPYMHDGRFATLEEVVEFYNSGIKPHPQLATMLREHEDGGFFSLGHALGSQAANDPFGRQPLRMHMTDEEKKALVVFMKTLSDYNFIRDPRFSDPFVTVKP